MHFIDFVELDDHIHMLISYEIYEIGKVILSPRMSTPFDGPRRRHQDSATVEPSIFPQLYMLSAEVEWYNSSPPQLLDPWRGRPPRRSLIASSNTHRYALIQALSQIRVETTTTPEGLIHMVTVGRATCIVFSNDDLPLEGSDHTRPLYISVGCSGRQVSSVLLDNGSALNVCHLATTIALSYAPSNFGPSIQTVRAYDSTRMEVMGTLEIELLIGPATFVTIFQVLRIPTSFNLLLGRPWIHRTGTIHYSLHKKMTFIHDGQIVTVQSVGDMFISSELVLQINHSDDDLFLARFTFDEHGSTVVLNMMRSISYLPYMGLERRQHEPSEFMAIPDHDVPFGLKFIPTEADYKYMARLCKERVRTRLTHMPFDYPTCLYTMSLADYFVRASKPQTHLDRIIGGLSTTQEAEL
ncbi:hypothetical protein AAG906_014812 [Vitis piasezkii]